MNYQIKFRRSTQSFIYILIKSEQMRHLLKKQRNRTFTSLKEMIANKSKEVYEYEAIRGIEFQKHLKQIILDRKTREKKIKDLGVRYDRICMTAAKPIETMLNEFIEHSKKYDESDLVQTTQYMARAFQISLNDHGGHLDRFGYHLRESPMFQHFIEEVKYALSDKAYIDPTNITKVLNSLGQMNYVDIQIIRLVILKIEKMMNISPEEGIKFRPRVYQSQKANYYKMELIGLDKDLLQSEIFQKNLAFLEEKKKQLAAKLAFNNIDKTDFETEEDFKNITQLINSFGKFNKSTEALVEGVIAIRQQYAKLVTLSSNQKVMRNPELNSAALIIEEKLLEMHLITFEDVKNPEMIAEDKKEQEKVAQIIRILMSEAGVDNFQDYFVNQEKDLDYLRQKKQRQLSNFSALIESLAKYANLPFRLEGTDDKISLLNVKWQRFFLEEKFKENNLDVERMFRKAFMETQKFILDNLSTLQISFIQGGFHSKMRWYSALIEVGLYEQAANELKGVKVSDQQLRKFNESELFIYIKILNNLYQSDVKPSQQSKKVIEQRIKTVLQEGTHILNISELCDTINYLYQANQSKDNELDQQLYKKLIKELSTEVKYIEQSQATNKQLAKEAKRILLFEDPEGQSFTGSLLQLSEVQNIKNQKANPYLKLLYDSLNIQQSNLQTPYIMTGINENNEPSAIYFANSNSSSIYGKQVSGHINAYCSRIYNKYGINVTPIAITRFVQVEYTKTLDSVERVDLKVKKSDEIFELITPHIAKNNQVMADFIKTIGSYLVEVPSLQANNFKTKKLLNRLKRFAFLYRSQKDIYMINQFYARRCQLLVQFNLLKRDLSVLSNEQLEEAHKKLFPNDKSKDLKSILSSIEKQLEKPLSKIQQKFIQTQQKSNKINFKGKRITLSLLQEPKASQQTEILGQNLQIQLLSQPYLLDHRYVEYEDWQKKIKDVVNVNEIKIQNARDITKLLIMKFCPQIRETIVALPQNSGKFYVPYYPLNWQKKYYYYTTNKEEKDQLEQIAQGYREASMKKSSEGQNVDRNILVLQNFKHQLKVSCSQKEILEIVLGLECIDDLMKSKLKPSQQKLQKEATLLQRDAKQYFNYLERKSDKMYLESPYLEYIFNKIEETEVLKQKIKERKQNKIKLQMLYNQGVIDRKQYFDNVKEVDERLIKELRKLKKKSLTHIEGPQILEDGSKIVQLNKNIEELSRIVSNAEFYDQNEDIDLILANGDHEEALQIKRSKAETNLIVFKLLSLRANNKKLTNEQQTFLSNWKKSIKVGIQSFSVNKSFTKKSIDDVLTSADKSRLSLSTNLPKFAPNLAMSDLILQLSLFLDDSVLNRLESQVYAQHFAQKYKISSSAFLSSSNKVFKHLSYKAEQAIFDKKSQLTQKDMECIIEMSKIFKTEALSDRQKYNLHYKQFRDKLQQINNCRYRVPLAAEYLKQKDTEYYSGYHPKDIESTKKQQTNKLWQKIFEKDPSETTASQIRARVGQLCQSMLFIKLNTPPYFGHLVLAILEHKNTDVFTKQKLIAFTELFKVPLQLDSADLEKFIEGEQVYLDKIMDNMRRVNDRNFSSSLYALL